MSPTKKPVPGPKPARTKRPAGATKPSDVQESTAFESRDAWEAWLARHHPTSSGLWLKLAKRGAPAASVSYPDAVEVALCYGWIDAQKRGLDATHWLQRFTPRGARSIWSKLNREKVARLVAAGRMKPAGLAAVAAAQADGRWEAAYDSPKSATVPDDLAAALARVPAAQAFFATLGAAHRYLILFRLQTAKRADTRARRIDEFVRMLAANETPGGFFRRDTERASATAKGARRPTGR